MGSEADFASDMSWLDDDGGLATTPPSRPKTPLSKHQDRGTRVLTSRGLSAPPRAPVFIPRKHEPDKTKNRKPKPKTPGLVRAPHMSTGRGLFAGPPAAAACGGLARALPFRRSRAPGVASVWQVGHGSWGSHQTARQTEQTNAVPSTGLRWQKHDARRSTACGFGARRPSADRSPCDGRSPPISSGSSGTGGGAAAAAARAARAAGAPKPELVPRAPADGAAPDSAAAWCGCFSPRTTRPPPVRSAACSKGKSRFHAGLSWHSACSLVTRGPKMMRSCSVPAGNYRIQLKAPKPPPHTHTSPSNA